jgi:hypothetical protein
MNITSTTFATGTVVNDPIQSRELKTRHALRESFPHCWFRQTLCNPAGAHSGKSALRLPGHFPVGKMAQQSIFFGKPRTTLGVAARNAQLAMLHFNRADRMAGADGHFCIRDFAQKCQISFCPRFPDRIAWRQS